jgi:MFS-type transporter involved in bile tolerance (Atg22 family)
MKKNYNKGFRNIVFLGLVSCFADISSEMVYPIIPLYLTAVLGATPALVGVIEGIAESVASLLKVFSGYVSDKFQKKKALAFTGYATGVLYKLALVFAGSWVGILSARVLDRFGKGIRTAPRDVMVAESADRASMGRAFGIHKMLDMAGSAVGILLAFILLTTMGEESYKTIFLISIIPVLIALFMFVFYRRKEGKA